MEKEPIDPGDIPSETKQGIKIWQGVLPSVEFYAKVMPCVTDRTAEYVDAPTAKWQWRSISTADLDALDLIEVTETRGKLAAKMSNFFATHRLSYKRLELPVLKFKDFHHFSDNYWSNFVNAT